MNKKIAILIVISVVVLALMGLVCFIVGQVQNQSIETNEKTQLNLPMTTANIQIISPNGGEKWQWGTAQKIEWQFSPEGFLRLS